MLNEQNKINVVAAENRIKSMSMQDKLKTLKQLEDLGYEYNPYLDTLLETTDTGIPYDFIFLCLLTDNLIASD
jgi:hypothetical protein